jgi:hypothetical protein
MPLILSANGSRILKWWVNFAVHPNLCGHSGGGLSMGHGFPIVGSTKHELNTQSSTESEIVGADDVMLAACWTGCFMEAQGHKVQDNILFQDNKSSMLLKKNGKASSSKRTKHVNIHRFFIADQIMKKELSVVWCPTCDMIGDHATKPLQGAAFKKFRDLIMGRVVPVEQDRGQGSRNCWSANRRKSLEKANEMVWRPRLKSGTTGVCWDSMIRELGHATDVGRTGSQKDVRTRPAQQTGNRASM